MSGLEEQERKIVVSGGARLEGRIAVPEGAEAGVVVAHPHPLQGGDMDNHLVKGIVEACAGRGLATLRFDFRHARTRVPVTDEQLLLDATQDLQAAMENLRTALPEGAPVALAGYSFGGLAAFQVAPRAGAAAVAVVGVPVREATDAVDWGPLAAADLPLLALQGQYDEVGKPDRVRALAADADVAMDVRVVPDASHGYFGEAGFVGRILAGFLAKRLQG